MPVPALLNNPVAYGNVWNGALVVGPRARIGGRGAGVVSKTFHAYVELYEQCAHDGRVSSYVRSMGANSRPPHGRQVAPANAHTVPLALNYYGSGPTGQGHGRVASQIVAQQMHQRWTSAAHAPAGGAPVLLGQRVSLAVQGIVQPNGFQYDVSMWYDGSDVYLAFHCF